MCTIIHLHLSFRYLAVFKVFYVSLYAHVRYTVTDSKHRFVKSRSTVTNLACYLNAI